MNFTYFVSLCFVVFLIIVLLVQQSKYLNKQINELATESSIDNLLNAIEKSNKDLSNNYKEYEVDKHRKESYPFSYILNPEGRICEPHLRANLTMLVFIPSTVDNYQMRMVLRSTWANYLFMNKRKMRYVFMVGLSKSETVNEMVIQIRF